MKISAVLHAHADFDMEIVIEACHHMHREILAFQLCSHIVHWHHIVRDATVKLKRKQAGLWLSLGLVGGSSGTGTGTGTGPIYGTLE